jgi:AcrR family transcriptional regulator
MPESTRDTKQRLLAAASQLFAAHGFHATTMRAIAARARVNLASGHYHYGSKKELYLEVLRAQFAEIRALLARRGAAPPASELGRLMRPALEALLRVRTTAMLDLLIGPPPGLHATLMQREMVDPSEALPIIVGEFIRPMMREVEQIVAHLEPGLSRAQVRDCAFSIVGQCLFYRFTMPAMLRIMGRRTYPRGMARAAAEHVSEFSLGGLARVATARRGGVRASRGRGGQQVMAAQG